MLTDKREKTMYDYDEMESLVGCFCTLLYPRRGQTEGTVVEDLGTEVVVKLVNGKEVVELRDEILIND